MNPKKVTRQKEQAQKNVKKQIKECERLQEKHQNKMARTYSKEESGTLSSSKGEIPPSSRDEGLRLLHGLATNLATSLQTPQEA